MKVVGVDVSKEKLDLCIFDVEVSSFKTIKNKKKDIENYLKNVSNEVIFGMETTGIYSALLACILAEKVYNYSLLNPLIIKRYSQMKMQRVKTDKTDSLLIAQYVYEQKPPFSKPQTNIQKEMLSLINAIDDLKISKGGFENRLEGSLLNLKSSKEVIKTYKNLIKSLSKKIKDLELTLEDITKKNYPKDFDRLLNISGVGKKSATIMIAYFAKFEDFENSKKVISFIGTNPSLKQSGTSIRGRGSISRTGNKNIRKILFLASWAAMKYNKSCSILSKRLKEKGKPHKVIRIAVLNKLLRQIFAILKYDREYDEKYETKYKYKFV